MDSNEINSSDETQPNDSSGANANESPRLWQPLTRNQRRVVGVLVEKSKTTPDVYPMTLNGIKTGANQKSNRSPKLDLQEHEIEDTLYELRHLGAVTEVHSGGRVPKFKHQLYDWLGVDKAELAVMAELLLRGEQTVGELRARAARMEKSIAGLPELKPILRSLAEKNLLLELTPAGRGQIVTHNLYQPEELERLRKDIGQMSFDEPAAASTAPENRSPAPQPDAVGDLQKRVEQLEQTVAMLQAELRELQQ